MENGNLKNKRILDMEISTLILNYLQVLIWPLVVIFALIKYKKVLEGLIPKSKIQMTIAGVTFQVNMDVLEKSVEESLRGRTLSAKQWDWLRRLSNEGITKYNPKDYDDLRPLRNAGLIKEYPEGWLTTAKEIEITTLGRLLIDAKEKNQKL
jgi:hypothetical protein